MARIAARTLLALSVLAVWLVAPRAWAQDASAGAPAVAAETRVDPALPPTSVRIAGVVLEVGCAVSGAVRAGDRLYVSCTGGRIRGFAALASGAFELVEERRAPGEVSALFVAEGSAWALSDGDAVAVAELPTVAIAAAASAASVGGAAALRSGARSAGDAGGAVVIEPVPSASTRAAARTSVAPAASESPGLGRFPLHDRHGRTLTDTRHENLPDRGLWGAGLGLFLAGWVLDLAGTAIFNAVSDDRAGAAEEDAQAWSLLPFVGPIVQLAIEAPHPALPITSGLLQITGCVLFVMGMTTTHDVEVPIYVFRDARGTGTARLGLDVTPTDGGAYATLTLHAM